MADAMFCWRLDTFSDVNSDVKLLVYLVAGEKSLGSRYVVEVTGNTITALYKTQQDIDGVTCPVRTWLDPAEGEGYFEYYDGPSRDRNWNYNWTTAAPIKPMIDTSRALLRLHRSLLGNTPLRRLGAAVVLRL